MPSPDPSPSDSAGQLLALLPQLDSGAVLRGEAVGPAYMRDGEHRDGARPELVLRPRDTGQVSAILAAANALRLPLVVQGGRTGLNGGARPKPGEISLSTERLGGLGPVDPRSRTVVAGAGTPLEQVQDAARAAGLYCGVDLGARGTATIGGNVATNAGGIRVLRYGMFRDQVAGLEVVLADGTVIDTLDRLPKDNAGYDLRQPFIGSEGTLGVITRARLHLHAMPQVETVAFVALPSLAAALDLLDELRTSIGPLLSAFELIDPDLYAGTIAHMAVRPPVPTGAGHYAMIEIHGADPDRDPALFEAALATAVEAGRVLDAVLSTSGREFAALWAIRDGVSEYIFAQPDMTGHDIGLPLAGMEAALADIATDLAAVDPAARVMTFGHAGDGNLHYMVQTRLPRLTGPAVLRAVARAGGTISAEHGIGRDKARWLPLMRDAGQLAAMARLKSAFDPAGILNPGRILAPST